MKAKRPEPKERGACFSDGESVYRMHVNAKTVVTPGGAVCKS